MYRQLYGIDRWLPCLKGMESFFISNAELFRLIFYSVEEHLQSLPEPWPRRLNSFHRIFSLKMLRPDKLIQAVQN
jgi:hypothetical protein